MIKHFSVLAGIVFCLSSATAQTPYNCTAPDFTLTDINGNTHHLNDYLAEGKTVILDFMATWCPPCWEYQQQHTLKTFYEQHGPQGDNTVMIIMIEADPGTDVDNLYGNGNSTLGDYVTGTPYPICSPTTADVPSLYNVTAYPTLVRICPNGTYSIGLMADLATLNAGLEACGCHKPTWYSFAPQSATKMAVITAPIVGATKYQFRYRQAGTSNAWSVKTASYNFYTLADVLPNTYYEMRVKSFCNGVWSDIGPSYSYFHSNGSNTCAGPTQFAVGYINETSVRVFSKYVIGGTNYRLQYKLQNATAWTTIQTVTPFASISNLLPNQNYQIRASVRCNGTWSTYGATDGFSTYCENGFDNTLPTNQTIAMQTGTDVAVYTETALAVWPNPATAALNIRLLDAPSNITILDVNGKKVKQFSNVSEAMQIDISDLIEGVYFARILQENGTITTKMWLKI